MSNQALVVSHVLVAGVCLVLGYALNEMTRSEPVDLTPEVLSVV